MMLPNPSSTTPSAATTALRMGRLILAVSITIILAAAALMAGTVVFLIFLGVAAFGTIAVTVARLLGRNDAVRFRLARHLKRRQQAENNPHIIDVN